MARARASLELKQAWMRERQGVPDAVPLPAFAERHYAPVEIAKTWSLSADVVRRLFEREPGVLVVGGQTRGKRRYATLRVPESVLERVHRRLSRVGP